MTNRRATFKRGSTFDIHGLYLFCSIVTVVALGLIGFGLLWMANH